jgi:ELWxxDGT repeat protein
LVKDINQSKNSYPSNGNYYHSTAKSYAVLNKIIYYSADDGIHGTELWRSDGTDTGTYMVKNIAAGNASSYPANITVFNNKIYFAAYNKERGNELYQSDGTTTGTILLKGVSYITDLTAANDELYFTTDGSL